MKEKILQFLKTNAKLSGVQDSYLLGVAEHYAKSITDETQIATTFTDGVVDFIKLNAGLLQSDGDKRATEAAKTALKNYQDKHGLDENGQPIKKAETKKKKKVEDDETDDDDSAMPAWAKKILADNVELKTKFEAQEKAKTTAALTEKITKHDKLKDIPASWLKGRNLIVGSEGEVDQLVTSIEGDYNAFKQEMADKGVVISVPLSGGGSPKEGEALGKAIAAKRNANSSDGGLGKKV